MKKIKEIKTIKDFQSLLEESEQKPVVLVKLSPVCPVSHYAEAEYREWFKTSAAKGNCSCYSINVIGARGVSREISALIEVTHQSPQALLFEGGAVTWVANHSDVNVKNLNKRVQI